jgi:HSP20 family protein
MGQARACMAGRYRSASAAGPGRAVFGYTVRMGLDGLRAEPFGDLPPEESGQAPPRAAASRAPIVDVFEEEAELRILAELPGVSGEEVSCTLSAGTLHIATTGETRYSKAIDLPVPVVAGSLTQSCRNGILEVRLRRADASADGKGTHQA